MHQPLQDPCLVLPTDRRSLQALLTWLAFFLSPVLTGCAALTNPVADGIPVRRLPPELLAPPRNVEQTIPLNLLGQPRPDVYRVGPGDVIGVYIAGVFGEPTFPAPLDVPPMVEVRDQRRLPPAAGYPVPILPDGTIVLPKKGHVLVQGKSLAEIQDEIRKLFSAGEGAQEGTRAILVTLMHARDYHVVVLRQEANNFSTSPDGLLTASKRGTGHLVDLRAHENDVLHALALTGGMPGLDVINEIVIMRGCFLGDQDRTAVLRELEALPPPCKRPRPIGSCTQVIHIPLRLPRGQKVPFHPEDVLLETGDVVFIEAREEQFYYTGGLLPAGEHVLPRDHDLDVLEALTQVKGSLINGAFATNNLSGNLIAPGIGGPNPTLLLVVRKTPGGGQVPIHVNLNRALKDPRERLLVREGDLLMLQEEPEEAMSRYFTQTFFNFDLFWQVIHNRFVTGVIDVSAPDRIPGRLGVTTINSTTGQ